MPGTFSYAAETNIATVTGGTSGSPADFASMVAADRAGTGTPLLPAWSPNSNTKALTYQVRPVELLALLISFAVAGKTAETDYIFITGTDRLGNAQTESIDVSAGNGAYVSTKYFRTITNIDCSDNAAGGGMVWADGTVAVTQPIWGIIWHLATGRAYRLDCKFQVGDGTTSTYFLDSSKYIYSSVTAANFAVLNNATFQLGILVDAANKTTKQGCSLYCNTTDLQNMISCGNNSSAVLQLYSCSLESSGLRSYVGNTNNDSCRIWNTLFSKYVVLNNTTKGDYYNNQIKGTYFAAQNFYGGSYNKITITDCSNCGIKLPANSVTLMNVIMINETTSFGANVNSTADFYGINVTCLWTFSWAVSWTGKFFRQYEIDLHLVDPAGANIASATVDLKDNTGASVAGFPLTTGADGKIAQQTVSRGYYTKAYGNTLQDYGPHTLTVTKAGYQDYQDVITIDRKMDLEVALLPPKGGVSPTNLGLVPLGVKQVAI